MSGWRFWFGRSFIWLAPRLSFGRYAGRFALPRFSAGRSFIRLGAGRLSFIRGLFPPRLLAAGTPRAGGLDERNPSLPRLFGFPRLTAPGFTRASRGDIAGGCHSHPRLWPEPPHDG